MKKKFTNIFAILFLGLVLSCQSVDKQEKPENLIPEDKMVDLLTDLLRLDAAENYSSIEFKKRKINTKDLIFETYKVDSLQFVESSRYYAEDFKVNKRIYDSVQTRFEEEKKYFDSLVKVDTQQKADEKNKDNLTIKPITETSDVKEKKLQLTTSKDSIKSKP
ncbi:protein of unknown function [Mesonia phycicola]|uniref:DUF4296 domain-containing protein n=1 Tax=Mesonia phycicola TaxID=579105 RepID=A0A1M6GXX2_9FLAO|nr:DUF4296 domain-containing protein [Mesonia phycicola]SHJ14774.1 protein of unknown function [Mesonia phycicola]